MLYLPFFNIKGILDRDISSGKSSKSKFNRIVIDMTVDVNSYWDVIAIWH